MGFHFLKDEKIKNVLGHFQQDFEGGVSAENLGKWFITVLQNLDTIASLMFFIEDDDLDLKKFSGAKFGGYGSFLPTYERSPPILSRPKTPQRNSSTPRSLNNLSMEVYGQYSY